ncbi:MAG: hypothetical protein K0S25_138 [Bacillus sp. (in: firmicutes)]|nr:hypothetical protein [Bacillus sp. (in: firmicutes)]
MISILVLGAIYPVFKPITASARSYPITVHDSNPNIVNWGPVTYTDSQGDWGQVGKYTIDNQIAFCFQHEDDSPESVLSYRPTNPYDGPNASQIRRTLYYGWGGPENIFGSNETRGIVITSLVLSHYYNGTDESYNSRISGYTALKDKVENGPSISGTYDLQDSNLGSWWDGSKQVSQTNRISSAASNSFSFGIPGQVTFVNENTGYRQNGGWITVGSNENFHFEAPASYRGDFNTGNFRGNRQVYSAIISEPYTSHYQTLGRVAWRDPDQISFSASFAGHQVTQHVYYKESGTNRDLYSPESSTKTTGEGYDESAKGDKWDGDQHFQFNGDVTYSGVSSRSGTVPDHDYDITFWYNPKTYKLTIHHKDTQTDQEIGNTVTKYTTHNSFDEWAPADLWGHDNQHNQDMTFYYDVKEHDGQNHQWGDMGDGDRDITFWYTTKWTGHANYKDNVSGGSLRQENDPNIWAADHYDKWSSLPYEFDQWGHHYKRTSTDHQNVAIRDGDRNGTWRGDRYVDFNFDPYQRIVVKHVDENKKSDVLKYGPYNSDGWYKVGQTYTFNADDSITWGNAHNNVYDHDSNDSNSKNLIIPYNDSGYLEFEYKLRRHVNVHLIDQRTGKEFKTYNNVDPHYVHQGDTLEARTYDHYANDYINNYNDNNKYDYTYTGDGDRKVDGLSNYTNGSTDKGIVNGDKDRDVDVYYYYKRPMADVKVKQLQIYTSPADSFLPVRATIDKAKVDGDYSIDQIAGMDDGNQAIKVGLYKQGSNSPVKDNGGNVQEVKRTAKQILTEGSDYVYKFKIGKDYLSTSDHKQEYELRHKWSSLDDGYPTRI